VKPTCCQRY